MASGEHVKRRALLLNIQLYGAAFLLIPFSAARAGTVHGTVKNGTTGQAAAGVELTRQRLKKPRVKQFERMLSNKARFSHGDRHGPMRPQLFTSTIEDAS